MSFKRQNRIEQYSTTADWLKDFARELEKKSYNIENLTNIRQMNDGSKKFATIEEKMADIKQRIGFDIIKTMHDSGSSSDKVASCECNSQKSNKCGCKIKTASHNKSHNQEDLDSMDNIIKYIKDTCEHESDALTTVMVISRCREEPGLRFNDLSINMEKLRKWIDKIIKKHETKENNAEYIPRDNSGEEGNTNQESEYWSHAFPNH